MDFAEFLLHIAKQGQRVPIFGLEDFEGVAEAPGGDAALVELSGLDEILVGGGGGGGKGGFGGNSKRFAELTPQILLELFSGEMALTLEEVERGVKGRDFVVDKEAKRNITIAHFGGGFADAADAFAELLVCGDFEDTEGFGETADGDTQIVHAIGRGSFGDAFHFGGQGVEEAFEDGHSI